MLRFLIIVSNIRDISNVPGQLLRPLNARSLALSVLLGSHPPELPARALVALAELFEMSGGTMRTALSRMVAGGDVDTEGGRYRLGERLLRRQAAQDAGRRSPAPDWNGDWHSVLVTAEQRDVAERRRFRSTMADHRLGELRPATWLRPANLPAPATSPGWIVTTGPIAGMPGDELTGLLWDLPRLMATSERLLALLSELRSSTDWDDPASIPVLFHASAAVVRHLRNDPLLPAPLTPDPWPGDALRAAYDHFEADHQRLLQRFLRAA